MHMVLHCLYVQDGWTPLMAASSSGHVDVVSALIEAHADVHTQDNVCSTNHSASLPIPHYMGVAGFWREGRGGRLVAQSI